MVGLGGLGSPTSSLSVMRPLVSESFFAIPDAVRLDNPKLMLWRELQQHGNEALQKSNKRWLVLGLRTKDHDSWMGILEGMLGHSRNPSPTSSTRDLPCSNARRAPN